LNEWTKAIPRSDRKLRPSIDSVCEIHFEENSLVRYFENKMPNGSIHRIRRDRLLLKKNAIPSIFPDLPQYLTTKKLIRNIPTKRKLCSKELTISNETYNIADNFNCLRDTLKNMELPNSQWFFSCAHNSLVLGYLDSNFELVKNIIISENDLNVKVWFLKF